MRTPDIVAKTSATRDGHEAIAPDLCPDVPPWLSDYTSSMADDEFPPVKSPLLMRARRVSLDSEASTPHTPSHRANSGCIGPLPSVPVVSPVLSSIGPEEPEWLRKRRHDRIVQEKASAFKEEIGKYLQDGRHHRQVLQQSHNFPPAGLFGCCERERNVVFVRNIDPQLTTAEGLKQDIEQKPGMPSILAIRLPLHYKRTAHRKDPERPLGNKGYVYIEFENAADAEKAVALLRETRLNGKVLKAEISQPTTPIYEPTVLFLPSLPVATLGEDEITEKQIVELIEREYHAYCQDPTMQRKRPRMLDDCAASGSKRRFGDQAHLDQISSQRQDSPPVEQQTANDSSDESTATYRPWQVKSIRFREEDNRRYGYVEFMSRSNVLEILRWQSSKAEPFIINGQIILMTPSIPKKIKTRPPPKSNTPDPRLASTLYLSNLPKDMKEAKLRSICEEYGKVQKLVFPRDDDMLTQGWALVEFSSNVEASTAALCLRTRKCGQKLIKVQPSTSVITESHEEPSEQDEVRGRHKIKSDPNPKPRLDLVDRDSAANAIDEGRPHALNTNAEFRKALGLD